MELWVSQTSRDRALWHSALGSLENSSYEVVGGTPDTDTTKGSDAQILLASHSWLLHLKPFSNTKTPVFRSPQKGMDTALFVP